MPGETDLTALLASMSAQLAPGRYAFATLPGGGPVPPGLSPLLAFHEAEGITLVLPPEQARAQGLTHDFPCRMITLGVHSALGAVGFIARVAAELAQHGIAVNPVSGFHHDHLFVAEDRADEALALLKALALVARPG